MNANTIYTGVLIEEETRFTVVEVCQKYHISQELVVELLEHGLFDTSSANIDHMLFDANALRRMEVAFRLHRDLDINLPGVALALDLLDELETIRSELRILKK